jgi:ABC-type transport system substrate-binding protein
LIAQMTFGDGQTAGPVSRHLAGGFWSLTEQEVAQAQGAPLSLDDRLAEARKLLDAAGTLDAPFSLQVADEPQLRDVAAAVAADLRRGGLFPIVQPLPLLPWFVNFRRGDFGMTLISHLPYESPENPMRFYHSAGVDATTSPFGFGDEAIDRLIERSWGETRREARRDTLLEAQRLAIEARPMVHLFAGVSYSAARNYVRDWRPNLPGSLAQYDYRQSLALPVAERPG